MGVKRGQGMRVGGWGVGGCGKRMWEVEGKGLGTRGRRGGDNVKLFCNNYH